MPASRRSRVDQLVMSSSPSRTLPRDRVPHADQGLDQLGLAVALDPGDAEHLPGVDVEADVGQLGAAERVVQLDVAHGEQHPVGDRGLLGARRGQLAADHQLGELVRGDVGGLDRGDGGAAADHGDLVGDASTSSSLWEMKIRVWPCSLSWRRFVEERVDLLRDEHRGRLVEDDDLRAAVEHLEDLHPLALADAEGLHELVGVEPEAVALGDLLDLGAGGVADAVQLLGAEGDVLQHGEVVGQHEVLEDHPDALGDRVGGGRERDLGAVDADRPVVGLLHAVQDLHQGGLAGAVLPDQGVDRPAADGDVDVVVGDDTGEPLPDAPAARWPRPARPCWCWWLDDRGHGPS